MALENRHEYRQECKVGSPDVLLAYSAGRVDADTAIRLDRHVPGCGACQQFLAAQRQVWEALDAFGPAVPVISASFDQQIYARIASERSENWWQRTWKRFFQAGEPVSWKPVGAMAFACLAVAVGLSLQLDRKPESSNPENRAHAEPVAEPVKVAFDDQEIKMIDRALEDFEMLDKMGAPAEELAEKLAEKL